MLFKLIIIRSQRVRHSGISRLLERGVRKLKLKKIFILLLLTFTVGCSGSITYGPFSFSIKEMSYRVSDSSDIWTNWSNWEKVEKNSIIIIHPEYNGLFLGFTIKNEFKEMNGIAENYHIDAARCDSNYIEYYVENFQYKFFGIKFIKIYFDNKYENGCLMLVKLKRDYKDFIEILFKIEANENDKTELFKSCLE